jgi:hypothetical protein
MFACPATDDFFRSRIDHMIDLRHPLAVLSSRMPWQEIEARVAQVFSRKGRAGVAMPDLDLFGEQVQRVAVASNAGRPRVPLRIMIALLYLKHAFNESDEGVVERWGETPTWQFFSGQAYFEHHRPCDATTLVKFRQLLGEEGVEELLAQTINVAVELQLIKPQELARVIVDSTVHHKAIAHPTTAACWRQPATSWSTQLRTPEVDCISKAKAKTPYEFGVKVGIASTLKGNLIVGARAFHGNPYDGHTLREQLEQATILMQDIRTTPATAFVDLGYRGVDADNPDVHIVHRGKAKRISQQDRRLLKRRQAIEPIIGHLKADHRMDRCHLKGQQGDRLHAVLCAAGYNIRWLLRMIARKGITSLQVVFLCLQWAGAQARSWAARIRSTLCTTLANRLTFGAGRLSHA